jgi:hypothetical protein
MKESLLSLLQFGLRAAMIAAKNRTGSLQLFIQLFEAIGPRQWLSVLGAPIVARARAITFSARPAVMAAGIIGGNASSRALEPIAEEALNYDISDESLEAAAGMCLRIPTLANTYCFTCPSGADT